MTQTQILIAGKNTSSINLLAQAINQNEIRNAVVANSVEIAIEKFHLFKFDVVVISTEMSEEEVQKLKTIFLLQDKEAIIVEAEDVIDIDNKITRAIALYNNLKKNYNLSDNAFAGMHCTE
jgi:PleD family two-component response regulator